MRIEKIWLFFSLAVFSIVVFNANAGDITPPGAPTDVSGQMYTTSDIYNRLNDGTTGTKKATFTEPSAGPAASGKTLDEIMAKTPVKDNVNGASPTDILLGKTYWGLKDGVWGLQAGTLTTQILSNTTTVTAGNYAATDLVTVDTDLTAANIATGVNVFGIDGSAVLSTGDAVVANVLAGKTFSKTGSAGLTGIMINVGTQNITPSNTTHAITAGYHDGTGVVATDANLVTGNIRSTVTIFGVAGKTEVVDTTTGDAVAGDMLSGKKAWVDGSEVTGNVPGGANINGADGSKTFTITDGLYSGSKTATANDTDLTAANIKTGVNILGITGTFTADATAVATEIALSKTAYVNGAKIIGTGTYTALPLVSKTGQTTSYTTGDDGDLEKGLANAAPRFTDNGDGTVTDNNTELIWLKNSNVSASPRPWASALADVAELNSSGTMNGNAAGDTSNSGSHQTDWRMPNINELQSLCNYGYFAPAISNAAGDAKWSEGAPFTGNIGLNLRYWSSTTYIASTANAWVMSVYGGNTSTYNKGNSSYV